MNRMLLTGLAALTAAPAMAQTASPTMTLYELPGYLGRSVTVTADAPDLAKQSFARRAQSARVSGSWQVCAETNFAGGCQTLATNMPYLTKSKVVSIRPTPTAAAAAAPAATANGSAATTAAAVDLDALDVTAGTDGQDVAFYARPALSGTEVSAGSNDIASATAFCKLAGATTAAYAGRARVQASNLIDVTAKARVRGYALRDVLCKR